MSSKETNNKAVDAEQPEGEPLGLNRLLGGKPTKDCRLATVISGSRLGETVGILVEFADGDCVVDLGMDGDDRDKGMAMLRIEQLRPWIAVKSVTPLPGGGITFEPV